MTTALDELERRWKTRELAFSRDILTRPDRALELRAEFARDLTLLARAMVIAVKAAAEGRDEVES